jgi:hypothetical protein
MDVKVSLSGDKEQVAIAALTAAAQRIDPGAPPGGEQRRFDIGEIACRVITAVTANLGGVEGLLAGGPGSWKADYIRQIVHSTAGEDEFGLLAYRAEPGSSIAHPLCLRLTAEPYPGVGCR